MRFLIDECLTPDLVTVAQQAGYEAYHVAHIGKASWSDWDIAAHAHERDFVVVTNNASDFRRLYANSSLHAGLVILITGTGWLTQMRLFKAALDDLEARGELINQALEVWLDGDDLKNARYDLPPWR
jgi:predicted nuclease of predicted toxin-antitoxin system